MIQVRPVRAASWLGPAFLAGLVVVFLVAPWSIKNKLDAVCFGI